MLFLLCLTAPIAALVEWLWLGTTLGPVQIICVVIILGGVAVAMSPGEHLNLSRRQLATGIAFAVLGATGNALGAVLSRRAYAVVHENHQSLDGGTAAFQRILGGLLISGLLLLLAKRAFMRFPESAGEAMDTTSARGKWRRIWPWVAMNSLAGQTLGVSCMQWALETTPTGIVMSITALTPLIVIPFARVFEGEKFSAGSLIGGAIAVVGVVGLTLAK